MHGRKDEKKEEERKRGTGGGREGGRKDVIKSLPEANKSRSWTQFLTRQSLQLLDIYTKCYKVLPLMEPKSAML